MDSATLAEKTLSLLEGKTVFVEGIRDEKALQRLGISSQRASGSPWRFVEKHLKMLKKEVVLLFDFDEEGRRKTNAFSEALLSHGIAPQQMVRKRIERVFGVSTVEEIPTRFEEMVEREKPSALFRAAGNVKGEENGKNVRGYRQILNQSQLRSRWNRRKTRHRRRNFWPDRRTTRR